jgi:hypothetical protein
MKERFKHLPSLWKYGLIAVLTVLGISSATSYYAGFTHAPQPKATTQEQVKGVQAPTATPTATISPTDTPSPTLTPTPTHVYIAPTSAYIPPTEAPATQSNSELDNNNYYINSAGDTVQTASRFCLRQRGMKPTVWGSRKSSDMNAWPLTR